LININHHRGKRMKLKEAIIEIENRAKDTEDSAKR